MTGKEWVPADEVWAPTYLGGIWGIVILIEEHAVGLEIAPADAVVLWCCGSSPSNKK